MGTDGPVPGTVAQGVQRSLARARQTLDAKVKREVRQHIEELGGLSEIGQSFSRAPRCSQSACNPPLPQPIPKLPQSCCLQFCRMSGQ